MKIRSYLNELSLMVTDLEIGKTLNREVNRMHKILLRLFDNLSKSEKKNYKIQIDTLKKRVLEIDTIDEEIKRKNADLQEKIDTLEFLIEIKESE